MSCQAEIPFENQRLEKSEAKELCAKIGKQISLVLKGIELEDDLSE